MKDLRGSKYLVSDFHDYMDEVVWYSENSYFEIDHLREEYYFYFGDFLLEAWGDEYKERDYKLIKNLERLVKLSKSSSNNEIIVLYYSPSNY
ncbi:MAG: hypothetical protein GF383_14780 [Candidatus Lokiarchaeota archaeon]|nr:hypothetical protein [Candidatus Lokiarchaeota archaeon]MBD3342681.1 hypothetical protein [Candidatus Lokiarchaeota archaeon]